MSSKIQNEIEGLPEDERWRLQRADGFLDLGMTRKAREELDRVAQNHRDSTPFRLLAMRLAMDEKDWRTACEVAAALLARHPDEPAFWIQLAYAKRRAENIEVAHHILSDALVRFPEVATISFNLACYECQLGRNDEAMRRLNEAFALDENCREAALEDEDLKPIWDRLGG